MRTTNPPGEKSLTGLLLFLLLSSAFLLVYGIAEREPGLINDSLYLALFALFVQVVRRGMFFRATTMSQPRTTRKSRNSEEVDVRILRPSDTHSSADAAVTSVLNQVQDDESRHRELDRHPREGEEPVSGQVASEPSIPSPPPIQTPIPEPVQQVQAPVPPTDVRPDFLNTPVPVVETPAVQPAQAPVEPEMDPGLRQDDINRQDDVEAPQEPFVGYGDMDIDAVMERLSDLSLSALMDAQQYEVAGPNRPKVNRRIAQLITKAQLDDPGE